MKSLEIITNKNRRMKQSIIKVSYPQERLFFWRVTYDKLKNKL